MQGCTNLGLQATGLAIPAGGALSSIACSQRCRAAGAGDCGKVAKLRSRRVHLVNQVFNQKLRLGGNFSSSFSFAGNGPKILRMIKQTGASDGQRPLGCGFIRCAGSGNLSTSSDIEVKGTIVLTKKYVIDLSDTASSLVDNTLDLLGYKVDFQLVSVDLDPSKFFALHLYFAQILSESVELPAHGCMHINAIVFTQLILRNEHPSLKGRLFSVIHMSNWSSRLQDRSEQHAEIDFPVESFKYLRENLDP